MKLKAVKSITPAAERESRLNKLFPLRTPPSPTPAVEAVWIDVARIDDNPYQYRTNYNPFDIESMVASFNEHGQQEPAKVRPYAEDAVAKDPELAGRYQCAFGHRRKYTVLAGGNAGSNRQNPENYHGKLLTLVEPLSDLEMRILALEENENRVDPPILDRARAFLALYNELKKVARDIGEKPPTWQEVSKRIGGLSYRRLKQLVDLLELPEYIREEMESDGAGNPPSLNERHGRALLELKDYPDEQRKFFHQIVQEGWSGNESMKHALFYRDKLRQNQPTLDDVVAQESQKAAQAASSQAAIDANRSAVAAGQGTHLSLVPATGEGTSESAAPASGTSSDTGGGDTQGQKKRAGGASGSGTKGVGGSKVFVKAAKQLKAIDPNVNYVCSLVTSSAKSMTETEREALKLQMQSHIKSWTSAMKAL
jgi:ParB/RepB/Spo0J family partition protein